MKKQRLKIGQSPNQGPINKGGSCVTMAFAFLA